MLKYILLLLACLTFSVGFKVNLTRTFFYLNLNEEHNSFFKAEIETSKITDTDDIHVNWTSDYDSWSEKALPMDFYIYYKTGRHSSQIGRFWPCDNPSDDSFKGVATYFFNKIIADFKRDKECPIYRHVSVINPGHLQFTRSIANGIYCDTIVSVHLLIYENVSGRIDTNQYKVFEVTYKGTFTDC